MVKGVLSFNCRGRLYLLNAALAASFVRRAYKILLFTGFAGFLESSYAEIIYSYNVIKFAKVAGLPSKDALFFRFCIFHRIS